MLDVVDVSVRFGPVLALGGVDLSVGDGEIVALMGPSGSGKSTLLRVIAGLQRPDGGDVRWDGGSILDVPAYRRRFGMMFQDYALFPHRTVEQNVAFGLRMQQLPAEEIERRAAEALGLVGLSGYGPRPVSTLSGGEQQRVALARTLAPRPRLILLDEPLGALDRALRERLVDEMRQIFEEIGATALYVTHDRDEAFAIADRVAVIDGGIIIGDGTPDELWNECSGHRVAELIGLERGIVAADLDEGGDPNATVLRSRFRDGAYRIDLERDDGERIVATSARRHRRGDRVSVVSRATRQ
jgi:thiamine transport system ATP-binding protein